MGSTTQSRCSVCARVELSGRASLGSVPAAERTVAMYAMRRVVGVCAKDSMGLVHSFEWSASDCDHTATLEPTRAARQTQRGRTVYARARHVESISLADGSTWLVSLGTFTSRWRCVVTASVLRTTSDSRLSMCKYSVWMPPEEMRGCTKAVRHA